MANIYDLTLEYQRLQYMLTHNVDDTSEHDLNELQKVLEITEKDIEEKADNYARIIKNLESDVEGLKSEEKRLKDKRGTLENAISRLKDTLQNAMIQTNKRKFKTDLFSFNIAKNGGKVPVIVDVPTEELADEFVIVSEKPDLDTIRKYIEETGDVTQFHLGERGESLRIK